VRKLATAAAVSLALASGGAFGLGLGDIEMRSALNQPMNAEIPLTSVKQGELDGMIVKLADEDAFARAGIDRSSALTDLKFAVDDSSGRPVIRVASNRAVTEPFLNFLLEVDWPQGRMVREYTVLLDPPVFMTQGASTRDVGAERGVVTDAGSALVAPAPIDRGGNAADDGFEVELVGADDEIGDDELIGGSEPGEAVSLDALDADTAAVPGGGEIVSLTDLEAPNTDAAAERAATAAVETADAADAAARDAAATGDFEVELLGGTDEVGDQTGAGQASASASDEGEIVSLDDLDAPSTASGDDAVTVARGDTLFAIAEDRTPNGVTVEQMMLALLEANRSSFIDDNINLVKAGSILRVPQAAEARALSQAQALVEIGRQDDLWRQYRDNLRGNTAGTRLASGPADSDDASADASGDEVATDSAEDSDALVELEDTPAEGLSANARRILEEARDEVRNRDELSIVADDTTASGTASATAEAADGDDEARLGEINRKLQLAREELAASRVEGGDLGEQAEELQSTNENLDALVSLRQNEIAKLESQLADARAEADSTAASTADSVEAAGDAVSGAGDAVTGAGEDAMAAAGDAVAESGDALAAGSDAAGNAVGALVDEADDALADGVGVVEEETENALSAAGETLESVDLVGEDSDADGATPAEAEAAATAAEADAAPWYQTILQDKTRLAIAGAGALGLLGVIGALFWRRRRGQEDDDRLAGFHDDDVDIIDDSEADELQAEIDGRGAAAPVGRQSHGEAPEGFGEVDDAPGVTTKGRAGAAAAVGTATAGAAAGAAALGGLFGDKGGKGEPEAFADADDDGLDKDDTISEADVYLAYGLHGQAEELLTKAIDRQPDNMEYAEKLLQTYHAQGNAEGYQRVATDYHARFGGEANPAWAGIAANGRELRPNDALFSAGAAGVAALGSGRLDGPELGDEDFASGTADTGSVGSITRDFGAGEDALDFEATDVDGLSGSLSGTADASSVDELDDDTDLIDQSLDPAFAFDEGDLEATGDFSQLASELAAEDNGTIDFPDLEGAGDGAASALDGAKGAAGDAADAASDKAKGAGAGLATGVAGAAAAAGAAFGLSGKGTEQQDDQLLLGELPDGSSLEDALTLDELDLDGTGAAANDAGDAGGLGFGASSGDELTLDLDELSSDLDMDATSIDGGDSFDTLGNELSAELDGDLDSLMGGDNEALLMDATGAPLDSADEMDTMMDLAKAYIDMGDKDSASNALGEIVKGGNAEQVSEAETLLRKIS